MSACQPFSPHYGTNQVIAVAAVSAPASIDPVDKQVRIVNTGSAKGYFRIYTIAGGVQAATVADCCVAAGMSTTVTKADGQDGISTISAATTTFEISTGEGW